ncbi:hypothetical protein ACFYUR_19265 [Micromonospora haikouensis]|uniref:hypothetical protein n=1 Tax=Micromonospora haikouensis TaxID=686309 RepID=UPI0036A31ADD
MMDLEPLREAARMIRERAAAATPGPWQATDNLCIDAPAGYRGRVVASVGAHEGGWPSTADAQHIASWNPIVALAVADWLDAEANLHDSAAQAGDEVPEGWSLRILSSTLQQAVTVARAYLGMP